MLENWNKTQRPEETELEERLKAAREKQSINNNQIHIMK